MLNHIINVVSYFKTNKLLSEIILNMNALGCRIFDTPTKVSKVSFINFTISYIKDLTPEVEYEPNTPEMLALEKRAFEAYNNVFIICKHLLVAFFGDRLKKNRLTMTTLNNVEREEIVVLLERIVYYWNKRAGETGVPTSVLAEVISYVDADTPLIPLHLARKSWMAREIIGGQMRNAVKEVSTNISYVKSWIHSP